MLGFFCPLIGLFGLGAKFSGTSAFPYGNGFIACRLAADREGLQFIGASQLSEIVRLILVAQGLKVHAILFLRFLRNMDGDRAASGTAGNGGGEDKAG